MATVNPVLSQFGSATQVMLSQKTSIQINFRFKAL